MSRLICFFTGCGDHFIGFVVLRRNVYVAKRLAFLPSDRCVSGSNPAGGKILAELKQCPSTFHHPDITEIPLKSTSAPIHFSCSGSYEPQHDKTNRMSVGPAKTQISLASAQSDQSLNCALILWLIYSSCLGLVVGRELA